MIDLTNEAGPILKEENDYISKIKQELAEFKESITDKAEQELRMGFRVKKIVDIRLDRLRNALR